MPVEGRALTSGCSRRNRDQVIGESLYTLLLVGGSRVRYTVGRRRPRVPHRETSRRAGCGKSARPVRRAGVGNGATSESPPRPPSTLLKRKGVKARGWRRHRCSCRRPLPTHTYKPICAPPAQSGKMICWQAFFCQPSTFDGGVQLEKNSFLTDQSGKVIENKGPLRKT
jgi:hypothetical protein